ncbi:MAG TPA: hypothetical protein VFE08_05800 [Candidatus Sulfotelmatobacter sp.]|jgi:hypothetical protein|nr:hypothetical protein [Candidatus Sulfotelmatobacter sp.]
MVRGVNYLGFTVVTKTSAAFRTPRRTIEKDVFARLFIMTNNIRFTTGSLYFAEGPEFFRIRFQFCFYFGPFKPS